MATIANDVIGIVAIYVGTQQMDCVEGSSIQLPGRKNNRVLTGMKTRRAGAYEGGIVKATPVVGTGDNVTSMFDTVRRGPMQVVCDTGQVFSISDAFLEQKPTTTDNGGKSPATWYFDIYTEHTASA